MTPTSSEIQEMAHHPLTKQACLIDIRQQLIFSPLTAIGGPNLVPRSQRDRAHNTSAESLPHKTEAQQPR